MTRVGGQARFGISVTELLLSAALLGALLLGTWGLLRQGFARGVRTAEREAADVRSRNVLDRFARMPREHLESLLAGRPEVEVSELADPTLEGSGEGTGGYRRRISVQRLPGAVEALLVRSRVSWRPPRAERDAEVGHSRLVFPGQGGAGSGGGDLSGFELAARVPGWGRSESWGGAGEASGAAGVGEEPGAAGEPVAGQGPVGGESGSAPLPGGGSGTGHPGSDPTDPESRREKTAGGPTGEDPGTPGQPGPEGAGGTGAGASGSGATLAGTDRGRGRRGGPRPSRDPGSQGRQDPLRLVRHAARSARFDPGLAASPGDPSGGFWGGRRLGEADLVRRLAGPGGELAAPAGNAPVGRAATRRRAAEALLARVGLASFEVPPGAKVPAGSWQYRLEAVDLRDEQGDGPVQGVYVLVRPSESALLVASRRVSGAVVDLRMEGDPVLERRRYRDPAGGTWLLHRTEERLYLVADGGRLGVGRLEILVLPGLDPSPEAGPGTRRAIEEAAAARSLVASSEPFEDPLIRRSRLSDLSGLVSGIKVEGGPLVSGLRIRPAPEVEAEMREEARRGGEGLRKRVDPVYFRAEELALRVPEASLEELDRLLHSAPGHRQARALRGRILAVSGRLEEGADDLFVAAAYARASPRLLSDLAGVLLRLGSREEARLVIDRLRSESPASGWIAVLEKSLAATSGGRPPPEDGFAGTRPPRLGMGDKAEGVVLAWAGGEPGSGSPG